VGGTIVILGLHGIMMSLISLVVDFEGIFKYLEVLIITIVIIPIIVFIKKYVPVLYGCKRIQSE
jgi:hypothetical protein